MALGKRQPKQRELFIASDQIVRPAGHPFYRKLNEVLAEGEFDTRVEALCASCYAAGGRPGIPPGVYFRMLFVGYFEGLDSQRGIAWRCADSLALREFLGYELTDPTPVHVSMTMVRKRLPQSVYDEVFQLVLGWLARKQLLRGKTVGIDATTLEANAAMKSIVRREGGADWKEYLRELAKAEGIEDPTDEDLRRFDRKRKGKKTSNKEWVSRTDPDSRITKMKDGRTHLAYKAEHTVDLETEAIVSAHVTHADVGDPQSGMESLALAQAALCQAMPEAEIKEVVQDKGYHDNGALAQCAAWGLRTYVPEREQKKRRWTDKPEEYEKAYRANRRRVRGAKGRRLNRRRSEYNERSFAHVCETGGGRRTWLRGLENVIKAHVMRCAGYNLGLLLRKVFGLRKPRNWEAGDRRLWAALLGALTGSVAVVLALDAPMAVKWLGMAILGVCVLWQSYRVEQFRPRTKMAFL